MKIYQTSQAVPSVPEGYLIRRVVINKKTGKMHAIFIRGDGSRCPTDGSAGDAAVQKFAKQMAETPIPGYGKVTVTDVGHTSEHWDHQQAHDPILAPPEEAKPEDEFNITDGTVNSPMQQGYGA